MRADVCDLGVLDNSTMSMLMRNILLSFAHVKRDRIDEHTQEGKLLLSNVMILKKLAPRGLTMLGSIMILACKMSTAMRKRNI